MANSYIASLGRLFRQDLAPSTTAFADRQTTYATYDAYYANRIYETTTNGGDREGINRALGIPADTVLTGLYNPVARCVDLYQHVLGGEFGVDILAVPGPTAAAIADPLLRLWQWSNMNQAKQVLCRLSPTHGTVGLRIVARNDVPDARRRVYIKVEHPRIIRDVELDERGNVEQIMLEYDLTTGLDTESNTETIRELQTKAQFTTWTITNGQPTLRSQVPNDLGVVPYVLVAHSPSGEAFSRNAFYRVTRLIDKLNEVQNHIAVQIKKHVRVTWLIEGPGALSSMDLSGDTVLYRNTQVATGDTKATPMLANLSLSESLLYAQQLITQIEDDLPELKATGGKFLSGQSGETVAQLRKPAEDRLALARVNMEDGLVRANMLALSYGVLYNLWDIGTGMGTREAAERAFQGGFEEHRFNERELLPPTEGERLAHLEARQRLGVSKRRTWAALGMSEQDIAENMREVEAQMPAPLVAAQEPTADV